jgi:hypothetical protein
MNILVPEFKQLLLALLKHKVNFILIGGYAVMYYGYERPTGDLDIWLEPDNLNRDKLISALREFGIDEEDLVKLGKCDLSKVQFFYFGEKPRRIDFLTRISNVEFKEAFPKVRYLPLQDKEIPVGFSSFNT